MHRIESQRVRIAMGQVQGRSGLPRVGPRSQRLNVPLTPVCLMPEFYFHKIQALVSGNKSRSWITRIWDPQVFEKKSKIKQGDKKYIEEQQNQNLVQDHFYKIHTKIDKNSVELRSHRTQILGSVWGAISRPSTAHKIMK